MPVDYEALRNEPQYAQDQLAQDLLGPLAHEQMVRSMTSENPMTGLALMAATPVYSAWKVLDPTTAAYYGRTGLWDATKMSQPSLEEIGRAAAGFRAGLGDWSSGLMGGVGDRIASAYQGLLQGLNQVPSHGNF